MNTVKNKKKGLGSIWLKKHNEYLPLIYEDIKHCSKEYIKNILSGPGNTIKYGAIYNLDYESKYINAKHGIRVTTNQPEKWTKSIYLLGLSWLFGVGTEDAHTIASFLQKNINSIYSDTRVVNMGVRVSNVYNDFLLYENIDIKEGDWCILFFRSKNADLDNSLQLVRLMNESCIAKKANFLVVFYPRIRKIINPSEYEQILYANIYEELLKGERKKSIPEIAKYAPPASSAYLTAHGCRWIDMQPYFNRPHKMKMAFLDKNHVTHAGTKRIADALFPIIQAQRTPLIPKEELRKNAVMYMKDVVTKAQYKNVEPWLEKIKTDKFSRPGIVGSIVMNCNPSTYGHQYLIEYAAKKLTFSIFLLFKKINLYFPSLIASNW